MIGYINGQVRVTTNGRSIYFDHPAITRTFLSFIDKVRHEKDSSEDQFHYLTGIHDILKSSLDKQTLNRELQHIGDRIC